MKRSFISCICLLALAGAAPAQPSSVWVNNGTLNCPSANPIPVIDATNVINNGQLNITLSSTGNFGTVSSPQPYQFYDVLNYTNRGLMTCSSGFYFNDTPFNGGSPQRSALFGNANIGTISGSTSFNFTNNGTVTSLSVASLASLFISATNVINAGVLQASAEGVLSVDGSSVQLKNGTLLMQGSSSSITGFGQLFGTTLSDSYWGLNMQTNQVQNGSFNLQSASSPSHTITNLQYQQIKPFSFSIPGATGFANQIVSFNGSNIDTQVVIVGNTNPLVTTAVRFSPFSFGASSNFYVPVVQIYAVTTNSFGALVTNQLYISDAFGAMTNFSMFTNDESFQTTISYLSPTNYTVTTFDSFGFSNLLMGNTPYSAALVPSQNVTNQYAALGLVFSAETFAPDPNLPDQTFSNSPGRVEINADNYLDLTRTIISGPNYLGITATNHFNGSANAQIAAPNLDINLGSTNGHLFITNLVAPYISEFIGTVDCYSARWTNVVNGVTNGYHVFMVGSELATEAIPAIGNFLIGTSTNHNNFITNLLISDGLTVSSNLLLNASSVTITSNGPGALTPYGQLNLQSANLIWSSNLPTLQAFTNFGLVTTVNATLFAQVAQLPYFTTNFTSNYQAFVNHGTIITSGNTTWTTYFENSGAGTNLVIVNPDGIQNTTNLALIASTFGPIDIIAGNAVLENGEIGTFEGDLSIGANSLLVSNHFLLANGALTLSVTNSISDGGVASNTWETTDGINLPIKPLTGDLLGTTVTNLAAQGIEVDNEWAGKDLGATTAGFQNNGALGHLILDGGNVNVPFNTAPNFHFFGPDTTNAYAIYVDQIDLRDGATNTITQNSAPFFTTFDIEPNFTVYFADAVLGTNDISEKLNGADNGRLVWVPAYAGIFSGTNVVYPAGVTNRLNRALVTSDDIDSNGNGIPNAFDTQPIYTAANINLNIRMTNSPQRLPVVSWFALANATNFLYRGSTPGFAFPSTNMVVINKTNFLSSTNGVIFTNGGFVLPAPSRTISVLDKGGTNNMGFYGIQVDPISP